MEENTPASAPALPPVVKSGANWFYWIAGLSVINSVIFWFGGNMSFVAGLGTNILMDVFMQGLGWDAPLTYLLFLGEVVIVSFYILMGAFANQGKKWAFLAGLVFYGIDSLIFLYVQDWFPFGFHLFAGFMIFRGFAALGKAQEEPQAEAKTEEVN